MGRIITTQLKIENESKLIMQWCPQRIDLLWIDPANVMPCKFGNSAFILANTGWSNYLMLICQFSTLGQLNIFGYF